ncbi:MAG: hypothetical protein QOG85_941 [Gaiellaceae bacterium]|nr:hypothetical protein [Gaiellaceae bacterium]
MSIRRLFWLGAAILFSIAALVAIAAVLGAHFGETEGRILGTCGLAFACGCVTLAGVACLDRGIVRPAAWAAIVLGIAAFAIWTGGLWTERGGRGYWETGGVISVWMVAALIVTTSRLVASSPRLLRTVAPATWVAAAVASVVGSVMILGETGRPWKFELVLVILTTLGYVLIPALQRFWADAEPASVSERLLGTLGNIDVFAVRGAGRSVTIGSTSAKLASSEGIVLREHT